MQFVRYCTQNELSTDHAPVYPYDAVIRLKSMVSIRLTAVNITAVNLQVWGLDGTGVLPVQPYRTNRIVRLRCAALDVMMQLWEKILAANNQYWNNVLNLWYHSPQFMICQPTANDIAAHNLWYYCSPQLTILQPIANDITSTLHCPTHSSGLHWTPLDSGGLQ